MLLTNHALTGVWLGSVIESPAVALPAGVASHLALDMLPHGAWTPGPLIHPRPRRDEPIMTSFSEPRGFVLGSIDFAGALTMLAVGLYLFPARRPQIVAGWLGAVLPDLLYLPEIFLKKRVWPKFKAFHYGIQWSESGYGIVVEALWAALMLHLIGLI